MWVLCTKMLHSLRWRVQFYLKSFVSLDLQLIKKAHFVLNTSLDPLELIVEKGGKNVAHDLVSCTTLIFFCQCFDTLITWPKHWDQPTMFSFQFQDLDEKKTDVAKMFLLFLLFKIRPLHILNSSLKPTSSHWLQLERHTSAFIVNIKTFPRPPGQCCVSFQLRSSTRHLGTWGLSAGF